ITRFGLERKLDLWQKPRPIFKRLKQLSRERHQIVDERTMVKNQLHAELSEVEPNATSIVRIKKRILLLDKQEKEIRDEMAQWVKKDQQISHSIEVITSIP